MSRRVRVDPEATGLVRVGGSCRQEGSGAQGNGLVVSGDEVVHGQVEVKLLRWTVRPSRSHIVVGSLERERDAGPIATQALPGVVSVIGDVPTQQARVELGESTGIGAVEHDSVESTNADPALGDPPTNDRIWCGSHAEQPMGPAPVMGVSVERTLASRGVWSQASIRVATFLRRVDHGLVSADSRLAAASSAWRSASATSSRMRMSARVMDNWYCNIMFSSGFFGWMLVTVVVTGVTSMTVTYIPRNPQTCYTGYVPESTDLVRLDVCGDPADLIVRFINTLDVEAGTDVLDTVDAWQSWLSAQGLDAGFGRESARDLEQARELRDDLRALASGARREQGRQVGIQVALTDDGEVELGADTAVGLIAAAAAKVAIEKRLDRVKICPADNCRWAFYDSSRNHSRQWCSMEVCGNRAKARAHRARTAPA